MVNSEEVLSRRRGYTEVKDRSGVLNLSPDPAQRQWPPPDNILVTDPELLSEAED